MMFPIILLNTLKLNFLNSYFIIFPYPRSSFRLLSGYSFLIYIYIYIYIYNIVITSNSTVPPQKKGGYGTH